MTDFNSHISRFLSKFFRILFITILLLFIFQISQGQRSSRQAPPLRERLFYGGNFGLQLGSITDIQLSPVIGIWLLPRVAVAAGPDYRFYKDRIDRTIIYGGKGYIEFVVIQNMNKILPLGANTGVFLHAEDEILSLESAFWKNPPYYTDRFSINTVLVGAGISQQMGRRSSLNMMFLWALNDSGYGIYNNPEIRVSFIF